jgi:hypothetical protein
MRFLISFLFTLALSASAQVLVPITNLTATAQWFTNPPSSIVYAWDDGHLSTNNFLGVTSVVVVLNWSNYSQGPHSVLVYRDGTNLPVVAYCNLPDGYNFHVDYWASRGVPRYYWISPSLYQYRATTNLSNRVLVIP